jgi:hypothetical protein
LNVNDLQQVMAGVYAILGRPSQVKLPYKDVQARINDRAKLHLAEMNLLSKAEKATRLSTPAVASLGAGNDFTLTVANYFEIDPVLLEYSLDGGATWFPGVKTTVDVFPRHRARNDYVAYAFYGDSILDNGIYVKLNIAPANIGNYPWRLTHRLSYLDALTVGSGIPLPVFFLPMLKAEVASFCVLLVKDKSDEWRKFIAPVKASLDEELKSWRAAWAVFLDHGLETAENYVQDNAMKERAGGVR